MMVRGIYMRTTEVSSHVRTCSYLALRRLEVGQVFGGLAGVARDRLPILCLLHHLRTIGTPIGFAVAYYGRVAFAHTDAHTRATQTQHVLQLRTEAEGGMLGLVLKRGIFNDGNRPRPKPFLALHLLAHPGLT